MSSKKDPRDPGRWARLRFAIVGPLLAAPPRRGQLQEKLRCLAQTLWEHPISGALTRFGFSTIERWYYMAKPQKDPVLALQRKRRGDRGGHRMMKKDLEQALKAQYRSHPRWSYQLHTDNLRVVVERKPELGPMPSYSTVRRAMIDAGMLKKRRPRSRRRDDSPWLESVEPREVRSFEAEYVHGLWHLDFHHGSLKVLTARGEWVTPQALAILDDHSRLSCHTQWYLSETAEDLAHGLEQGFLKRGLPRSLLSDNGAAMVADEIRRGLLRLGIRHTTTLPYSPYQNGKQEVFWAQVEGRLMAMLEGSKELTLALLNEATQAWVEREYHRTVHSEIGQTPLERYLEGPNVGRDCPGIEELRLAFCTETSRRQRRSDGTLTLYGIRFEIPSRFRHLPQLHLRYASWDLAHVYVIAEPEGTVLCRIYPLDKTKNASGKRRSLKAPSDSQSVPEDEPQGGVAPLLDKLIEEHRATGLPPAYLPKICKDPEEE